MKRLFSGGWFRNRLTILVALCSAHSALAQSTNCVNPPPGLVSLWRANATAADSAGAHDGATPFGIAYATGMSGEAFDFNASQRRVSIADSPEFILTNSFSIEGWINPRQSVSGFIFFRGDNRPGLDAWTIDMYQSGQINFQIDDEQNNYARVLAPVQVNQWQHIAATFDGSSGDMKVYVNGTLTAQTNTIVRPVGALDPNSEPALGIGNHGGTFHQFPFDGLIDELSLYSRALSAAEVQAVFLAGSAGKCDAVPSSSSPQIFAFWPLAAAAGETVSITGNNFGEGLENNIVYFGAVKADVIEASSTNLVVQGPAGATFAPITVTANNRIAYSPKPFQPTFSSWDSTISAHSLTNVGNLAAGDGPAHLVIADLDGDGKPDLAVADALSHTISLYRNVSTPGQLSSSNFDARVTLPGVKLTTVPYKVEAADLDCDGKLDLLTVNREANTISIYRNTSVPGTLNSNSFAPRFELEVDLLPLAAAVRDLDADGRPEIITANFSGHSISVLKNHSSPGNLDASSFAPAVNFPVGAGAANLACGDLDDDGWPDIAVVNFNDAVLSVLKNQGYTGLITNTSFAPRVDFPAPLNCEGIALGDIDGDGRLDLVFGSSESGQRLCVMRNATTSGMIATDSFEPRLDFPTGGWTHTVGLSDLNGDAKLDIVAVSEIASQLLVLQNASSPGSLTSTSLLSQVNFSTGWNPWGVSVGDLDADKRPDIAFCNFYDDTITIYKNGTRFSPRQTPCAPVFTGLISWWRAESNAVDAVGIDHGTLSGSVQFTPGQVGQAFDLSTGYVTIPDRDTWAFAGNDFTIELWARFNSGIANSLEHPYGGLLIGNDEGPFWVNKWFFAYGGGVLSFHINDPTNGPVWLAQTPFTPSANDWYHLAISRQSNTFSIYINGTLAGTDTSSRLVPNASAPLTIGYSEGFGFSGALDEVSLFNRALSPTDLMSIYAAGPNGKCVVPPVLPAVSRLINIDFGAGNAPSDKTGFAAIGETRSDFWNFVTRDGPGGWLNFTSLTNLRSANGSLTSVGITVTNGPGAWGNGSTDPMYVAYIYPFDGGSMLVTITNLPTGRYDVLPYGSDGNYELSVGNVNYGVKPTRDWPLANPPAWTEGVQFARFTNVFVSSGVPLLLTVHPGQDAYAVISGLQLLQTSTNPVFAPVIVSHPTNVSTYVGRSAQFRVLADGDEPLRYQWFFNGSALTGGTNSLLSLADLGLTESGDYFAVVSNAGGSATSHVAHLEVKIPPPCTPPAQGLVSVWRLDGNALDGWGDNDGIVLMSSYGQGKVGSALSVNSFTYVRVPDAPTLNPTNAITIEAWVRPAAQLAGIANRAIVSKSPATLSLGNLVPNPPPATGYLLGTTTNSKPFFVIGNPQSATSAAISPGALPLGEWTLLAGTFDGATVKLYTNGVLASSQAFNGSIQPAITDLSIGGLLTGSSTAAAPFSGLIDDVAFYNRALSPAELLATYTADISGRCATPPRITLQPQSQAVPLGEDLLLTVGTEGSKPMKYQWQLNGTNIPLATQRRLLIERVEPDHAGFYTVSISNQVGHATSVSALVKLLPAPTCVPVPEGLIGWWTGDSNTLDAISGQAAYFSSPRFAKGKVSQSFNFSAISSGVSVGRGFTFPLDSGLSLECWIKIEPTNLPPSSPFAVDAVSLIQQRFLRGFSPSDNAYALSLQNGRLAFSVSQQSQPPPFPRVIAINIISTGPNLRDGRFHHVAATLKRGFPATVTLYVDGQPVHSMSSTNSFFTGPIGDSGPLSFGAGMISPIPAVSRFVGQIDEVSIYNRALLPKEIQALADAGAAGKCKVPPTIVSQPIDQTVAAGSNATFTVIATGSPELKYQWLQNTNMLAAATNSVLSLTNVQSLAAGVYSVRVTNVFGSVTSSGAQLLVQPVLLKPGNTLQFQNAENGWTLNFTGEAGRKYAVQCSTNLMNWTTLGEAIEDENGHFRFVDPEFAKHPACFYRIVER